MADQKSLPSSQRSMSDLAREAERFAVRLPGVGHIGIPRPEQMAYFAGLGALVALGLLEWPTAVAIGVGQLLLTEHAKSADGARTAATTPEPEPAHEPEHAASTASAES
ncbi:hypothetical protein [Nocardia higoensis]|uniref:hypothetical protein n=1 Tax=Nocardia higoensis TaxID=228599 RepID=UPI001E48835B|nr:hypothetical protein [Nocardia higoensis]